MKVDFSEIDPALSGMLDRKEHDTFLTQMRQIVYQLEINPTLKGRALFVPSLDAQLQRLAEEMLQPAPEKSDNLILHVATEVYATGGHTRVIEDIARALPEFRHILILTDAIDNYSSGRLATATLKDRFDNIGLEVRLLAANTLPAKTRELAGLVQELAPRAIYLCGHLFDPVLNAAVSGKSAPHVLFVHHGDSLPCLGASRKDYLHLDLNPGCHPFCKTAVDSPAFIGLTVRQHGESDPGKRRMGIAVTCGAPDKYMGKREFSYGEVLATLFACGIRVVHVGAMSGAQKVEICNDIKAASQNPELVHFIGNVLSLSRQLVDIAPEFFLCSYPIGGGKAMLEAMSVGLPILAPRAASTPPLICVDMSLGNAVAPTTLAEIPAAIQKIRSEGPVIGKRNHEIYRQHYSMQAFRQKLLAAMHIAPR